MCPNENRIGPYVLGPVIGRGASGVVHEATDEALRRRVALKVLSEEVARTPEQRARFAREARLLAAVKHPNVAVVYGVVEEAGELWLALEYLEGETLADVLERGPLPLEEALDVARQLAAGLEAAHECGVVHRDLKPANAKLAPDGTVKVLDFGLARPVDERALEPSVSSADGVAVGTPLYMSPEQLRGRRVDRRADVWAFGCVLWELLCGERPFGGASMPDVLGAILERDPDPDRLPPRTPPRVRELVLRCLEKDPRQRLRDVGDARLELETALAERAWLRDAGASPDAARTGRRRFAWVALAAVVASLALGWWTGRRSAARLDGKGGPTRLVLGVPRGEKRTPPRIAPDGETLVHEVVRGPDASGHRLVARRFDAFEDVAIPGTERVRNYAFSPGGERLAVLRDAEGGGGHELALVRLDGSEPSVFLGRLTFPPAGRGFLAWLADGRIVLSAASPPRLVFVPTDGSATRDEVPIACDLNEWPDGPDVFGELPGGARLLASSMRFSGQSTLDCIVALDVSTGEQTLLVENSSYAQHVPSGHLLYSRADVLFAAAFDTDTLELGESEPIARGLLTELAWKSGFFHASERDTVVWWPGGVVGAGRTLWHVSGAGLRPWSDDAYSLEGWMWADRTGAFVTTVVSSEAGSYELWGSELEPPNMRRLGADPRFDYMGGCVDLERRELIACRNGPSGAEVRRMALDDPGEGDLLFRCDGRDERLDSPTLSCGGTLLTLYRRGSDVNELLGFDLSAEPPLEPRTILEVPPDVRVGLDPDGRWLLTSERRGRGAPPTLRRVHADGGVGPPIVVPTPGLESPSCAWAVDSSRERPRLLLWSQGTYDVHEVELEETDEGVRFSAPRVLVELDESRLWDAAHLGGDRFLGTLADPHELDLDRVHVLSGALAELGAR